MLTPVPQPHWQTKHIANGARMKSCTTLALLTTLPVSVCDPSTTSVPNTKHMHTVHTCTVLLFAPFWFHAIND